MMTDEDDDLLAIEVDADSYATAAVQDTPTVSRTHQTEEAFQAIKATYQAKQHDGNLYTGLISDVPELNINRSSPFSTECGEPTLKVKLDKRQQALFGYVVGELYYDRDFETVVAVQKWMGRAQERIATNGAKTG
nr:hypothetical protein B0A51_03057 [Rachicladosporium sp. CCFEE 5018]